MRDLNGVYAQWFNRRHRRDGHLFQGRYRAILIDTDEHLLTAVAYIVRNPVRAGMCDAPGDWPWSSHRAVLGQRPPGLLAVDELLSHLAPTRATAREQYRDLTERSDADQGVSYEDRVIDGSGDFFRLHLGDVESSPEIAAVHLRPQRPSLGQILADARDNDAIVAAYEHGYSMPAIARHLGLHPSTISRRLTRRRAQIKT